MAMYYWSNIQAWVDNLLEENWEHLPINDAHDWVATHIHMRGTQGIRDWVDDTLNEFFIQNDDLRLAVINSVDWQKALDNLREYMIENPKDE